MANELTPEKSFETLKSNVVDTIQSYFPFEGRHKTLVVENIRVEDNLRHDDITSQAEARDKEATWGVPIKADIKLVDKATGKVVDQKKGQTLARLPKLTNRYGYIVGGNEYQVDHLFRLKSGVYSRVQDNGDLETEFNLAKSPIGRGFSVKLDRVNKKFSLKLDNAHIPLYPILKATGVSDDQMEQAWGKEIFAANKPRTEEKFNKALADFWKRTSDSDGAPPTDPGELAKHINTFLDGTALRPDTTALTLGKPVTKVDGQVLQMAADKILGVAKGTHKPDDRDSLAFKEVWSAEDFIPEKISKNARTIRAKLRQTIDHKQTVGDIISSDLFNRPIHEFFSKGGSVAERSDQTNPIQMLSAHRKTTLMSKELGGIKSEMQVTDDMRKVNPSHLGFLDPLHTPESERTGITLHLAAGVRKVGKDLETSAYDLKTGKMTGLKIGDFSKAVAILPDQVKWVNGKPVPIAKEVKVKMPGGEVTIRPASEATHVLPSSKAMFNYATNLVPFLPCDQGNRVSMADKQLEQCISLKHREAPLVQTKTDHPDPNHTFEKLLGEFNAAKATESGTVTAVKNNVITLKSTDGKKHEVHLYDHFPLNDPKGMMHSEALVKVGDSVRKGQVLADTNFTKNGRLAYGTNLRVGYIPFKGYNFEDGIVISESASKKLTSEHLYKKNIEVDPGTDHISKEKLKAHASVRTTQIPKEHWDALDENGIVKPGTKLMPGQIMVAAVGKNTATKSTHAWGALGKKALSPYKDKSLTWDEDHVGVVTKVIQQPGGKGVKVYVKTEEPAVVGDKISGRHGNKGIITQILPDHEMPFTKDATTGEKRHIDVALNPSGVPTRINVGQMLETAAAKIAEKTGKPYIVDNFAGEGKDYRKSVLDELQKHGLTDEELIYDPKDVRRPLGSVVVGPQYILKQRHQVEKKLTARGGGTDVNGRPMPYDIDKQPTKGGDRGGQGFGALEMYSLLGHNARHNIREMATYKSDQQDMTFWSMVQSGHEPPPPRIPFAYQKFEALLKGLGVNVVKEGTAVRLLPMTDKEILKLAGNGRNEIKDGSKTLLSKNLKPEAGGLFDPIATGGLDGDKWAHLKLAEPIPNPIFVGHNNIAGPIPALLGLKMAEVDDVMAGRKKLEGKTGGHAIEEALKKVDVDHEIDSLKASLPALKDAPLDRANKKLKYLQALKETGMKPHEAYILHSLPIIPPKFRPATTTPTGDVNYSSLNGLYKNISLINDQVKNFDHKHMPGEELHPLRSQIWDSMKALQSIGSYKPVYDTDRSGNRQLAGILDIVGYGGVEGQPKEGFFQAKLVKRKLDMSMRSTIVPEPSLGIDEVGLPKHAAMEMYKPFVVAQLHRWGMDPLTAQNEMKKGTPIAFKALEQAANDHLVILKRDPALHKASVQAFRPRLIEGKAIQIHPLICNGFNADFDGDTMAATVPMTRDAVEEAKKMLPSANLFSPTHGGVMYSLDQEQVIGLHYLGKWGKKTNKIFDTIEDAKKAEDRGEIHLTDVIKLKGAPETTLGRLLIAEKLPSGFSKNKDVLHDPNFIITKGVLGKEIGTKIAKEMPQQFAKSVDGLKDLGNKYSFKMAASFGLKDFAPLKERDAILSKAHREVAALKSIKNQDEREKKTVEIYQRATAEMEAAAKKDWHLSDNRLSHFVHSGARGKTEQLRQMIAAPMLMQDASGKVIPIPVTRSYAEGLDFGDYWLTQHGARKGTLQRSQGTSEPGAISKDILNSTMSTLIVSPDCGTNQGILMDITHKDIHDRYLAAPYKIKGGPNLKAGTLVTPEITSMLKNSKVDKVLVRSPLKCSHGDGICAKCFGLSENGRPHDIGTNIGILAGQSIGEPASQMSMDSFHSGGVAMGAGASSIDAFTRLRQIVDMPKTLKNEATLAHASGKISDIKKDAAGGVDVFINGVRHYIPKHLVRDDIKVGLEVKKGQKLSGGFTNPHTLLAASKDIHTVQNYLTSALHTQAVEDPKNSEGDGLFGGKSRRRNVEVVVRALTNLTKIKDPGHSDYVHGDIIPRSEVEEFNRNLPKGKRPIEHEPILKGVSEIPSLMSQNWMARLNYQELHSTVQQAASKASKSEIHGSHPIPGMAIGTEFGKPPPSKKKHVY